MMSLMQGVIMPVIGAFNFSNYYLSLSSKVQSSLACADAKKQGVVIGYGQFLPNGRSPLFRFDA